MQTENGPVLFNQHETSSSSLMFTHKHTRQIKVQMFQNFKKYFKTGKTVSRRIDYNSCGVLMNFPSPRCCLNTATARRRTRSLPPALLDAAQALAPLLPQARSVPSTTACFLCHGPHLETKGLHPAAFSIYKCMRPPHTQLAGIISGQPARSGFEVCVLTWLSAGGRLPAATRAHGTGSLSSSSAPSEKRWARCKGDGMGAPFPSGNGDQLLI